MERRHTPAWRAPAASFLDDHRAVRGFLYQRDQGGPALPFRQERGGTRKSGKQTHRQPEPGPADERPEPSCSVPQKAVHIMESNKQPKVLPPRIKILFRTRLCSARRQGPAVDGAGEAGAVPARGLRARTSILRGRRRGTGSAGEQVHVQEPGAASSDPGALSARRAFAVSSQALATCSRKGATLGLVRPGDARRRP